MHSYEPSQSGSRDSSSERRPAPAIPDRKSGQLDSLKNDDGYVQITVGEGDMPQFIIDANEAVKAGNLKQAAEILCEDALEAFQSTLDGIGSRAAVMLALAKLLYDTDQFAKADEWYKKVLELEPHAFVYNSVADIQLARLHYSEALEYRSKAVEVDPDNKAYWLDYAKALILMGRRQEGLELLRKRVDEAPDRDDAAKSVLLWHLHYVPESTPQMFYEQYKQWGEMYVPISMAKTSHNNDPDPDRRLRIGYISPDFRRNVVARSFEPFLDGHNREQFEIYGYGRVAKPDKVTERFEKKFDHYTDIRAGSIGEVVRSIEDDGIDILVEIGGHCRDGCLGIVAYKPAPIQIDYGGIDTSGMEQLDYRLTDTTLTPPHMEEYYVEESLHMDGGFFSYRPPRESPLVGPLPARENGYVTFASFNNSLKINTLVLDLWARVLNANENSRFVMKFQGASDEGLRNHFLDEFEKRGIDRSRIDVYEMFTSHFGHLELHNKVDLILDTYPFNGCITTLESLWMGVPIVSLCGHDTLVSRSGLTILTRVGLEIFAASDPEQYVEKANAFAGQLDSLEQIRAGLRSRILDSDLCDPKRLTRSLEAGYRRVWRRWCESQSGGRHDAELESQAISG